MPQSFSPQSRGFALIATVLSLLVFSVTLSLALLQFSVGSATTAETVRSGAQALALVEGCAEGVINEIRSDATFNDTSFTLPTGECVVDVDETGGDYVIRVEAEEESTVRRVTVELTRGPLAITVHSWLEE